MSLFNTIMAEVEDGGQSQETSPVENVVGLAEGQAPAWWIDDKTPGTGERPDWLPEKFKSAADVTKAYKELEKKFGTAPESYDWSKGEGWIDTAYEPFQELETFAKSKHVPQDVMDKMLDSVGKYLDEFKVDYTEEKAKLGENVGERLQVLNNWAKANFTDDTYHALTSNMRTADAVKAIEEMRNKMIENKTTIPTGNEDATDGGLSLEDVQQELNQNFEKYKTDPSYRRAITAKLTAASKQSSYVDKNY